MTSFHYIVIGLSLALLIFLLWKEAVRERRARLPLRIIVDTLMVAAFAAIALPLSYERAPLPAPAGVEGVLSTEGTDADSLRQFMQSAPAGTKVFTGDAKAITKLHVFGYGLTGEQWEAMRPLPPLVFHASPARTGLRSVGWQQRLRPGNKLRIQGRLYRANDKPVTLHLIGLSSLLDSAVIGGGAAGEASWELQTVPPQSGRAVYHLLVLSGADTLEQESLPVEVLPPLNLKILFLAAAPDFENRFLASWLSSNGYGLAVRTAISKGRSDKAWVNMPQTDIDHLSVSLLDKFDVVIADATELQTMGPAEAAILRGQIAGKGLGLIIKADSSRASAFYKQIFPLAAAKDSAQQPYIKDRSGTQPLLRDSLARNLVSKSLYGSGKLVFTTLTHTYSRILSGDRKAYAVFWSTILGTVSRDEEAKPGWRFFPARPRVDEPVRVVLETEEGGLPQAQVEESPVYLNQHPFLSFYREGRYYPGSAGWQMARTPQGDSAWWYSWAGADWNSLRRQERWTATMALLADMAEKMTGRSGEPVLPQDPEEAGAPERAPIAKGWFYITFLLCCIFLWVERKI